MGCDWVISLMTGMSIRFQSTHPSGVRPDTSRASNPTAQISIHAPQWGATRPVCRFVRLAGYFNPRTPVGCDFFVLRRYGVNRYFNPRTPVGCDFCGVILGGSLTFQSTHPSGVRLAVLRGVKPPIEISIHAPQWGATRWRRGMPGCMGYFNPRTPVGCDVYFVKSVFRV